MYTGRVIRPCVQKVINSRSQIHLNTHITKLAGVRQGDVERQQTILFFRSKTYIFWLPFRDPRWSSTPSIPLPPIKITHKVSQQERVPPLFQKVSFPRRYSSSLEDNTCFISCSLWRIQRSWYRRTLSLSSWGSPARKGGAVRRRF